MSDSGVSVDDCIRARFSSKGRVPSGGARRKAEKDIQNEILRAFATLPGLRLWVAPVGVALTLDGRQKIRFGIPGQADLTGILPGGRRLEIEVKSDIGTQRPAQKSYQKMIEKFGGLYVLARSVEDVRRALEAAGVDLSP